MGGPRRSASAVSFAKPTRPSAAGALRRERIFEILDEARQAPVVWVSGPPGCGKTTALSSYAQARAFTCLWYQLDAGDAELGTFFYFLGLAAERLSPRGRSPLPLFTAEFSRGVPELALIDKDGDGLTLFEEVKLGTDPDNPDTDGDGLSDGDEIRWSSNALLQDTDGDGLSDGEEVNVEGTDPLSVDTDGDSQWDFEEVLGGSDPLDASSLSLDRDGDWLGDEYELWLGTDPLDFDTDGDGSFDGEEVKILHSNPLVPDLG